MGAMKHLLDEIEEAERLGDDERVQQLRQYASGRPSHLVVDAPAVILKRDLRDNVLLAESDLVVEDNGFMHGAGHDGGMRWRQLQQEEAARHLSQNPRWGEASTPDRASTENAKRLAPVILHSDEHGPSSALLVAVARYEGVLGLIPSRLVPARVNTEVVGDVIERLTAAEARGLSRWHMRGLMVLAYLVIVLEIARSVARGVMGKKALRR